MEAINPISCANQNHQTQHIGIRKMSLKDASKHNRLRCDAPHVVFQECPNHVSLCFSFYGCPLRCSGCHSEELWNSSGGRQLSNECFQQYLTQYAGLITCVVFFGGEWRAKELQRFLMIAQQQGLKTCLYTGLNHVSRHLRPYLNYAKIGPWQKARGGLNQFNSNQRFYRLEQGKFVEDLSHLFRKEITTQHNQDNSLKDSYHAAA